MLKREPVNLTDKKTLSDPNIEATQFSPFPDAGEAEARRRRILFHVIYLVSCSFSLMFSLLVNSSFPVLILSVKTTKISTQAKIRQPQAGSELFMGKSQRSLNKFSTGYCCIYRELAMLYVVHLSDGRSSLVQWILVKMAPEGLLQFHQVFSVPVCLKFALRRQPDLEKFPQICRYTQQACAPSSPNRLVVAPVFLARRRRDFFSGDATIIQPPLSRHMLTVEAAKGLLGFSTLGFGLLDLLVDLLWPFYETVGPFSFLLWPISRNSNQSPTLARPRSVLVSSSMNLIFLSRHKYKFGRGRLSKIVATGLQVSIEHQSTSMPWNEQCEFSSLSSSSISWLAIVPLPRYQISFCRGQKRSLASSLFKGRMFLDVSLSWRGLFSIDLIDENSPTPSRLLSSVMVRTGPVEVTVITTVKTEASEFSKTLVMWSIQKSVELSGLKTVDLRMLDLASVSTSPDDLSSYLKLVSLSVFYDVSCALAFLVCFRVYPIKHIYLVT